MQHDKESYDYLIAGQGIAGTLLALELLERGKKVLVCDKELPGASTRVAQGIMNPVGLKWYSVSWNAEIFFPFAFERYRELEKKLKARFFIPQPLSKIFVSPEDRNHWIKKTDNRYFLPVSDEPVPFNAAFGHAEVGLSAILDTEAFLQAVRGFLSVNEAYLEKEISYSELENKEGNWRFNDRTFSRIIFCEGHRSTQNPWFNYLPVKPVKGDTLTLELSRAIPEGAWHRKIFLVPTINGTYRAGATYAWHGLASGPDVEARKIMEGNLDAMIQHPFKTKAHHSGIRPAVSDRRPLLGSHPTHHTLFIFNGFGSKGISMAPWLAAHFCDYLQQKSTLLPEINITRFQGQFVE